ncbi:MAG: F0F1 ATP synthase subunit gamma [Anaerolineae bacterium]|nr:F0F1 ATP synthase subunit gamma [Anaerolineae bacterium]
MEDLERLQSRLNNIRTVEPILDAMQTISTGNWQLALRQQSQLAAYREQLLAVLPALQAQLALPRRQIPDAASSARRCAVLAIGAERGLCGNFNNSLVMHIGDYFKVRQQELCEVELLALGGRLVRLIRRRNWPTAWTGSLSVTALPGFAIAQDLTRRCLADYEARRVDAVDVIYNAYRKPGLYVTTTVRWLPPEWPTVSHELPWPPPIVETDPFSLYTRILEQWITLHLYQLLLDSATAEHSARLQLMEAATQNSERLIAELTQLIQSARKQAITQEMQELAAGAGLITGPVRIE